MDSITDQEWREMRENAQELLFSVKDIQSFFDAGEPIESLETALDQAQGDASIKGEAQFIVIRVRP